MSASVDVPPALRRWFVIHFAADLVSAVPLFVAPTWALGMLGWQDVDPVATRLVAAALFGIGIESYLGRNASAESYRGMLELKIIWSAAASLGLAWSLVDGAHGRPVALWAILATFIGFNGVWVYWRVRVARLLAAPRK